MDICLTIILSIMHLAKLSEKEKSALRKGVIQVTGKAMNRTALGVVDALLTLYPGLTFAELKHMLPDSINPSAPKNYKSLFKPYTERLYGVVQPGSLRKEYEAAGLDIHTSHFAQPGETFKTKDGVEVLVSKSWETSDTSTGENDLQNLIQHVEQWGVRVVKVDKNEAFTKGGYDLEIINPALLASIQKPRRTTLRFVIWGIILVLLALLIGFKLSQ
jgi:hypothetical protein